MTKCKLYRHQLLFPSTDQSILTRLHCSQWMQFSPLLWVGPFDKKTFCRGAHTNHSNKPRLSHVPLPTLEHRAFRLQSFWCQLGKIVGLWSFYRLVCLFVCFKPRQTNYFRNMQHALLSLVQWPLSSSWLLFASLPNCLRANYLPLGA